MPLRVLVVDDTALYRKLVSEILREIPGVEVVGTAINGRLALEKIGELSPDLVTLDLEMPELGGVDVLKQLRAGQRTVAVLMLSAYTSAGAAATTEALRLGAFDFVLKPASDTFETSFGLLKQRLTERVQAFFASRGEPIHPSRTIKDLPPAPFSKIVRAAPSSPPEIIVLGISTGGPDALGKLIPAFPADMPAPIFIVQHMPPLFTKSLADDLNHRSQLHVFEAVDGHVAQPGECLVAPGGKQMKIERTERGPAVRITDDPPENSCRPAVDYLFRSAAHQYGGHVLAVVMTGMGSDGTLGCRLLKRHGVRVLAQDKATCVVFGMPAMVIEQGLADAIVPLPEMAAAILSSFPRTAGDARVLETGAQR